MQWNGSATLNIDSHLPRWRNGSVFLLHGNGSGSIPLRGTKGVSHLYRLNWKVQSGTTGKVPSRSVKPHWVGSIPTGPTTHKELGCQIEGSYIYYKEFKHRFYKTWLSNRSREIIKLDPTMVSKIYN